MNKAIFNELNELWFSFCCANTEIYETLGIFFKIRNLGIDLLIILQCKEKNAKMSEIAQ